MEKDKLFVEDILKGICDYPSDIVVDRKVDEMGVLLTIKVNQADMGKVIGKEGATAKAIKTLARLIGAKSNSRVNVRITDPRSNMVENSYNQAKEY